MKIRFTMLYMAASLLALGKANAADSLNIEVTYQVNLEGASSEPGYGIAPQYIRLDRNTTYQHFKAAVAERAGVNPNEVKISGRGDAPLDGTFDSFKSLALEGNDPDNAKVRAVITKKENTVD